jgi:hypothetical protein
MNGFTHIVTSYKSLLEQGENIALIEKFYAEDIVQVENNEPPIQGKAQLVKLEIINIEGLHSFSQQISRMVIDELQQLVMGEMIIFFDSRKQGKKKLAEAFTQQWKDGKIIYQKFYYKDFEDAA